MFKKLFVIIVPILILLSATIYMAVKIDFNSKTYFDKAGYILSAEKMDSDTENSKSTRYYFDEKTEYGKQFDDTIKFKDTNEEDVKVGKDSFIHYTDNSVSLLKKGVILNLQEVNSEVPRYYNLFENTTLEYSNAIYYVDNLGKKLKFKSFIVRISEDKFLLVGDGMKLKFEDGKEVPIKANYVEFSFVDEGIIKIENQEASYQTIAKDASIILNEDLYLNLDNEYFFYKNEAMLNLEQIIIDSDDNIDIKPLPTLEEEEEEDKDSGNDGFGGGFGGAGGGAAGGGVIGGDDGIIDDSDSGVEQEFDDKKVTLPSAVINDLIITSNKLEAGIEITDKDGIISGTSLTTVTEVSTSKIVYEKELDEGVYSIDVVVENLLPETTYALNTRINYKKNDIEYSMDVIQHVFVTESMGVSISKDYYTDDTLAFLVKIDDYSKVKSATISLTDTNGKACGLFEISSDFAKKDNGQQVIFGELKSDTKYIVKVNNILYDNYVVSDSYAIETSAKTLKQKPEMGQVSYTIDKKSGSFILRVNNIVDVNNGIETYKYEIYDGRTMGDGAGPVTIIEKNSSASVELVVDDKLISRNVPYVFRVVGEFYDNEKYIEYVSEYSQPMRMDGVAAPSISWEEQEITFERIKGILTIHDDTRTVDVDKPMTIIYTNSIGTTKSFTTFGNVNIPFDCNNLRANETYTISVYASVNLQDGNPSVDMYHVGSVAVQTKPTLPFEAEMKPDYDDVSRAFNVQCRLGKTVGEDNTLEAKTLTGVSFSLFEGSTINGRLVKTIKKVDPNMEQYISELKLLYYDNYFTLDPAFFGFKNSDLNSEFYTILISTAYDYTDFSNEIPIKNNIVTVKTNGTIPDAPEDIDNAVDFHLIRNKDLPTDDIHYNPNLAPETIVGMRVRAIYDNTKKLLKEIYYTVYDETLGEEYNVDILNDQYYYKVPASGEIKDTEIWFTNGKTLGEKEIYLSRGHRYKVRYTAKLDLNLDGTPETPYPSDETIKLRSKTINVPKEKPNITMYPSTSTNTTLTVCYTYKDPDHALTDNIFHAAVGSNVEYLDDVDEVKMETTKAEGFITFANLKKAYLKIYNNEALYNYDPEIKEEEYIFQHFEGEYILPDVKYTIEQDTNKIRLNFKTDAGEVDFSHIVALKVVFSCPGYKEVIKDYVPIINGFAVIDIFSISQFINKEVSVRVSAYYDTGLIGFDSTAEFFALKNVKDKFVNDEYYYTLNNSNQLVESSEALNSIYKKELKIGDNLLKLTNMITPDRFIEMSTIADKGGYSYNFQHMNLKELKLQEFGPYTPADKSFTFTQVIPGISLLNRNGDSTLLPTLRTLNFKAKIYGFSETDYAASKIKDDIVYIDLVAVNDLGQEDLTIPDKYRKVQFKKTLKELEDWVELEGLLPKQNYTMTFKAYIASTAAGSDYEYKSLYDVDENTINKIYNFKTLSKIRVDVMDKDHIFNLYTESYNNKFFEIPYNLDTVVGYDLIEFKLYERVYDRDLDTYIYKLVDIEIPNETVFTKNMVLKIPCNPGSVLKFGSTYKLVITPVVQLDLGDGTFRRIDLENPAEYEAQLPALRSPTFGVTSSVIEGQVNKLVFRITKKDVNQVIPTNTYKFKLFNMDDVEVTELKNVVLPSDYNKDISDGYKAFTFMGLDSSQRYKLVITYDTNTLNSLDEADYVHQKKIYYSNPLNESGISLGTVTATANLDAPNAIDITFRNSYKLDKISRMRYSIYNVESAAGFDGSKAFTPQQIKVGSEYVYRYSIPEFLTDYGVYYVQLQFFDIDGKLVAETTLDYTYVN